MNTPIHLTEIILNDGLCGRCHSMPIAASEDESLPGEMLCQPCNYEGILSDAKKRGVLLSIEELGNTKPAKPFIKGTIMQNEVTILVGPPGSYKTFLALDWAMSIASPARDMWQGRKIQEHCPVLYVTNEGVAGLDKRVRAWRKAWKSLGDEMFNVHIPPEPLWDRKLGMPALEEVAQLACATKSKLIVFDTLSSLFGGIGENGAEDIALITNRLAALRNQHGLASLVIHHSPKSNPDDARGSGALKGNTDAMVVMNRNGAAATIKTAKVKDDADWSLQVRPQQVSLGSDDEGNPISSLILESGRSLEAEKSLKAQVLDAIPSPPESVTSAKVRLALGLDESSHTQVTRAISQLINEDVVEQCGKTGRSPLYSLKSAEEVIEDWSL